MFWTNSARVLTVIVLIVGLIPIVHAEISEPNLPWKLVLCGIEDPEDQDCHVTARFKEFAACEVFGTLLKQGCGASEDSILCLENFTPKFRTYCTE